MWGIELPNPIENLTKFAPSNTIQTKMIWFSDIMCVRNIQDIWPKLYTLLIMPEKNTKEIQRSFLFSFE